MNNITKKTSNILASYKKGTRRIATMMLVLFCFFGAVRAQESLTVYEGTRTSYYVPFYSYYYDAWTRSQFIVPASMLSAMVTGSEISSMIFYTTLSSAGSASFTTDVNVDVYVKELDATVTSISAYETKESSTVVYSGKLSYVAGASGGQITINFSTPFTYNGGTLLIGSENTALGSYQTLYFKGVNANGASGANSNANSTSAVAFRQRNFGPMTTFRYDPPGKWKAPNGVTVSNLKSTSASISWTERGEATSWVIGYMAAGDADFTEVPAATNPFLLTGLSPQTEYTVKVRPVTDDESIKWSDAITFTTPESFPTPQNVEVDALLTTATVTWDECVDDNGAASSYNVRYREPAGQQVLFADDFEKGLDNWTIYTEGESPETDGWYQSSPNTSMSFEAQSGTYCASAWSWSGNAYNADNWLVTPQVTLGKKLEFWVRTAPSWPDAYEVLLATRGNSISDFGIELQAMDLAPQVDEWTKVSIDLTEYEGEQGYIAIHHVSYDANYLLIDNFSILGDDIAASEWQPVQSNTNSVEITGLTANTKYEVEVQAVYGNDMSGWSNTVSFSTIEDGTKVFLSDGDWNVDANWLPAGVPATSDNVIIRANVVIPSGFIANVGTVTINGGSITLKDGAEIKTPSVVAVTFEKNFAANTPQLVSLPFSAEISATDLITNVPGMFEGIFDFYAFDSSSADEWINIYQANFGFAAANGRLYGSSTDKTLSFQGNTWGSKNKYLSMGYTYSSANNNFFNGWFLTGNTFPCTGSLCMYDSEYNILPVYFYKLRPDGYYDVYQYMVELAPGEGVFIETDQSGTVEFSSEWLGNEYGVSDPEYFYLGYSDYPVLPLQDQVTNQDATPVIPLEDDNDNTAMISALNGVTGCNIVLADRTLWKDNSWNTLCLPFDIAYGNSVLSGDNVVAKVLSSATIEGTTLNLTFEDAPATIPAGTPFIIKWDNTGVNLTENDLIFRKVDINSMLNPFASTDGSVVFAGSYAPVTIGSEGDNTMLYIGADNKLYWPNGAWSLGAQRAAFYLWNGYRVSTDDALGIRNFNVNYDDATTGILTLTTEISQNDTWYSLDGRRLPVKPTTSGLYIFNGKKVIIK